MISSSKVFEKFFKNIFIQDISYNWRETDCKISASPFLTNVFAYLTH